MHHIIIGCGPAGVTTAETLRQIDREAEITMIGNEGTPPYSRMALPYLLAGTIDIAGTHLRAGSEHYSDQNINLVSGHVSKISATEISLSDGKKISFDRLLIATGSKPVRPPVPGIDLPQVQTCWTLEDADKIADLAKSGSSVLLMGAGFIGCIVMEAMMAREVELMIVEAQDRMVPRMMDETGGEMIRRWCEQKGVVVKTGTLVEKIAASGEQVSVAFSNGADKVFDLVVCAAGVTANIGFVKDSGIKTDAGILVNHNLQTSMENIYAAGDVAQGPEFFTGQAEIHAIQPTASEHGRIAGLNMAGMATRYQGSLSMNVLSTLGLVSASFGQWQGVEGGDITSAEDPERFKYIRLCFYEDMLVGALMLGFPAHTGVLRGLMQSKTRLGKWKQVLMKEPGRVMEAWLACSQPTSLGKTGDLS